MVRYDANEKDNKNNISYPIPDNTSTPGVPQATYLHKLIKVSALVPDERAVGVLDDAVREDPHGSDVATGEQLRFEVVQTALQQRGERVRVRVAARLVLAAVRVKIHVSAGLQHSKT